MSKRLALPLLLGLFAASACRESGSGPAAAHAPFSPLTYEQALERARTDDRVVLLDFTAGWCPPCREMEKTTWPDAGVQEWIGREAVAVQVDVDRERELSAQMGASSIPTVVFLDSSGEELGRFVGYRDPAGFLAEAAKHVD